ncbi:protein I'm not dead yet isoform X1 [Frankliniella occidentalis]|uniref:Protein I'm not dead yet isoform X1 n=1 Tax=Frankliniella occidentalis TaxID=133901 RepID=A0A6J1RXT8_FRAOC|nr:protein I'm not dead yet isoform X1 [Frankliniella occidentalis]
MAAEGILVYWRSLVVILTPLILLPLPLVYPGSTEARAAYGVLLLAVFWVTEVVPLPVTSLLPVVLFPVLGVLSTEQVCVTYLKETNMMFIGGLIVAIAVEHCNLHKRIALRVMMLIGASPRRLMLGFMIPTMFLSMWISNTATTAMMVPIVSAVLDELKAQEVDNSRRPSVLSGATSRHDSGTFDQETRRKSLARVEMEAPLPRAARTNGGALPVGTPAPRVQDADDADDGEKTKLPRPNQESVAYYLGVAYAANIGGTGTLTGTATNLTFKGLYESLFPSLHGLNFANWMLFNVPLMLINAIVAWLWLQVLFMGLFRKSSGIQKQTKEQLKAVEEVIATKYRELGVMTFHEGSVMFLFLSVVVLWFFRAPEFIPGWAEYVSDVKIKDATPAVLIVFLLFVLPANLDFLRRDGPRKASPALLNWKIIHEKLPWGLVLLIGGGFAMAAASRESGLSKLIGAQLVTLQDSMGSTAILVIMCTATTFLTEVSSNTAIANIVLPVLAEMASAMRVHPLFFMMPATLCCSYAFMLPVATPPNAIVMAASNMRPGDMIKAGLGMNFLCLITLFIMFPTLASWLYGLDVFPPEAAHIGTQSRL